MLTTLYTYWQYFALPVALLLLYLLNKYFDLKKWVEFIGVIGGLVVAAYGSYNGLITYEDSVKQSIENSHQLRVDNAFALHTRYISGDISDERIKISTAQTSNFAEKKSTIFNGDTADVDEAFKNHVTRLITEKQLDLAIEQLTIFYKEVYVCVLSKRCDEETTTIFFLQDATAFYYFFKPHIDIQRELGAKHFAMELEKFVNTSTPPSI